MIWGNSLNLGVIWKPESHDTKDTTWVKVRSEKNKQMKKKKKKRRKTDQGGDKSNERIITQLLIGHYYRKSIDNWTCFLGLFSGQRLSQIVQCYIFCISVFRGQAELTTFTSLNWKTPKFYMVKVQSKTSPAFWIHSVFPKQRSFYIVAYWGLNAKCNTSHLLYWRWKCCIDIF